MNTQVTNRKWIFVSSLLAICLIVYVILFPPVHKTVEPKPVAKVNGVSLNTNQLYDVMLANGGKQSLETMINEELIRQEAEKTGVQVTDSDIDKELASIKSSFPSEDEFQQALSKAGMTLEDLRTSMKSQVILKKILAPEVTVNDDAVKKYYDENLESLKVSDQVKASHITVATKEEADTILINLKNGADFAATAQEKSLDTATKDKGGDLGYITRGSLDPALEASAFALEVGHISDAVQTSSGYDIISVTDHKEAYTPTLEEKKEELHQHLVDEQVATLSSTWLEKKKSESTVENYLNGSV
jgi:foldase protein PrsA